MAKSSFYTGSGTDTNAVSALQSLKDQAQTSATNAASSATAAASSASTAASNATAAASSATSAAASVASLSTDVATQSAKGLMSAADKTKLDGVESGSTGDQTAAEIKTAYESNSNTNAFTDAEQTKLSGIESSADVTDATNVQAAGALMDSEVTSLSGIKTLTVPDSTTVSTFGASLVDDADAAAARTTLGLGTAATTASTAYATAAQGTTADAALPKAGGTMTGNIVMSGAQTVDGRDLSVDGAKLDNIEANATADQTAAEIEAIVNHDNLQGFVSNEHIDWTASGAGTIHATNIPVVALTTVQTAANQTAHLALTAQEGDIVVRSDENKSYVHNGGTAGTMADYTELLTPTDAVLSVNGQTGAVTISNATTSSAGLMSSTDKTKLDGVETSADVTDATNVQAAGALMDSELTSEASVKAINQGLATTDSPTFAGLTSNGNIIFEGATADDFETTLTVTDPNADRTITLPDANGTVVLVDSSDTVNVTGDNPTVELESTYEWTPGTVAESKLQITNRQQANSDHWEIKVDPDNIKTSSQLRLNVDNNNVVTLSSDETQGATFFKDIRMWGNSIYLLNGSSNLIFEGATNDDFETTVTVTDPTADRTITLPDQTGTAMLWQSPWPDDPSTSNGNIPIGYNTLASLTSGAKNIAIGLSALDSATSGSFNLAIGDSACDDLTTGTQNVAFGNVALKDNLAGSHNVCVGYFSGRGSSMSYNTHIGNYSGNGNSTGSQQYQTSVGYESLQYGYADFVTAVGYRACYQGSHYHSTAVGQNALGRTSTSLPYYNVAVGSYAGNHIYSGDGITLVGYDSDVHSATAYNATGIGFQARSDTYSTCVGYKAGYSAVSGSQFNTLIGSEAGYDMDGGDYCTFVGYRAGYDGGSGSYNTGIGRTSLDALTTGAYNSAFGQASLSAITSGEYNTGVGSGVAAAITSGDNNTIMGARAGYSQDGSATNALTTGSNVMCLGFEAIPSSATATNEITLGDNGITSLRCNVQTISSLSDERDKTAIADIPYGLDFINDMRPVQFTWNRRDGSLGAKPDIGFIAQELNDVELNHSSSSRTRLVSWENPEKLEADYVRSYPILVKAVQELSAKCDALEARLAALEGA